MEFNGKFKMKQFVCLRPIMLEIMITIKNLKPWPNGLSRRKFWTCVSFGHPLASTCVGLWSSSQIWTQGDASFLPFGHPAQVDTS